jgi:hypothetical protein
VCTADLEDELIRALGHAEQFHRFMGTRSGRGH